MAQTGESWAIPQTCDLMIQLTQNPGDREIGLIRGTVLKNRLGGEVGKQLTFNVNYSSLRITDVETVDNIEKQIEASIKK